MNINSHNSNSINSNEAQTRLLQLRIDSFEKILSDIYTSIYSYARKTARTRDEADLLASHFLLLAQIDNISTTLRSSLSQFSQRFSKIQDYRNNQIHQIEEKVINEIILYGEITRKAKEELKNNSNARNKILNELKEGKLKDGDRNRSSIEFSRIHNEYEQHIEKFERKKIEDIKKILLNFIEIELRFNAKTIHLLTQSFQDILSIDEERDIIDLKSIFNFSQLSSPLSLNSLRRPKSLDIENELITSPLRRFNSSPNVVSNPNKNESSKESKKIENKELQNKELQIRYVDENSDTD